MSLRLTQFICKTTPLILNLKSQGQNSVHVRTNLLILLIKPYPSNFQQKFCNSKQTPTQPAGRKGLSTNHYFAVISSMIDGSSGNPDDFVLSPRTGRLAKAISSEINQNIVPLQCLIRTSAGFQFSYPLLFSVFIVRCITYRNSNIFLTEQ